MKTNFRKLAAAGLLGSGILGATMSAQADTPVSSWNNLTRNITPGTFFSPALGPVSTVQCALTKVQLKTSTTQAAECRLQQSGGQWFLAATVVNSGASVVCSAHCYQ